MNNLSEFSSSYTSEAQVYRAFSEAEDYPNLILDYLIPQVKNLSLLDAGCGNGKYQRALNSYAKEIIALDRSYEQLQQVTGHRIQADCTQLPLADNSQDITLCAWMLGTIGSERRIKALREIQRVTAQKIILIENDTLSQFEVLRGHIGYYSKTEQYHQWLKDVGFDIEMRISTYFQFPNLAKAQEVFYKIWKIDKISDKIISPQVEHKVVIFARKEFR